MAFAAELEIMGWLVVVFATLMAWMAIDAGSQVGAALAIVLATLIMPPLWKRLRNDGRETNAPARWVGAIVIGFVTLAVNCTAYSKTPQGIANEAKRQVAAQEIEATKVAEESATQAEAARVITSGEHCFGGWHGSLIGMEEAVKKRLRDPDSYEFVDTERTPVNSAGKFGVILTYRAHNGFGGMNVEKIAAVVRAESCSSREVSVSSLAKRLRS
jgi:hypothetical protein